MPAIFSRLSLWFAAVFAALLVVRAASGRLGLSARALRSLQLCLLLFCGHSGSGAASAREFEHAQYGRCGVLTSACGTSTGRQQHGRQLDNY